MNIGTIITLAIVAAAAGLAIKSMIRDKKNGKSLQCGGDCSRCGGHCH
ncbi:MAG: FeoB-associated Cys-rich membrane protein [Lachnospiraceae bacterium]|nr:FeoB-associated Cys-rich membrane protein [Lachnospiraceae bacterium]